ncbi:hypothetical protein BLNAU_629 [Blattamonas nauphoetae]|uniref:Uncharacterized protein n=1 Tax=Blattamonas nauphoetae TaxID=2049346 RepID=A0ABQ9YK10_9EUKA|nr:hypothetical protein BLNAU_629 [Blattamonas nauphoetae]
MYPLWTRLQTHHDKKPHHRKGASFAIPSNHDLHLLVPRSLSELFSSTFFLSFSNIAAFSGVTASYSSLLSLPHTHTKSKKTLDTNVLHTSPLLFGQLGKREMEDKRSLLLSVLQTETEKSMATFAGLRKSIDSALSSVESQQNEIALKQRTKHKLHHRGEEGKGGRQTRQRGSRGVEQERESLFSETPSFPPPSSPTDTSVAHSAPLSPLHPIALFASTSSISLVPLSLNQSLRSRPHRRRMFGPEHIKPITSTRSTLRSRSLDPPRWRRRDKDVPSELPDNEDFAHTINLRDQIHVWQEALLSSSLPPLFMSDPHMTLLFQLRSYLGSLHYYSRQTKHTHSANQNIPQKRRKSLPPPLLHVPLLMSSFHFSTHPPPSRWTFNNTCTFSSISTQLQVISLLHLLTIEGFPSSPTYLRSTRHVTQRFIENISTLSQESPKRPLRILTNARLALERHQRAIRPDLSQLLAHISNSIDKTILSTLRRLYPKTQTHLKHQSMEWLIQTIAILSLSPNILIAQSDSTSTLPFTDSPIHRFFSHSSAVHKSQLRRGSRASFDRNSSAHSHTLTLQDASTFISSLVFLFLCPPRFFEDSFAIPSMTGVRQLVDQLRLEEIVRQQVCGEDFQKEQSGKIPRRVQHPLQILMHPTHLPPSGVFSSSALVGSLPLLQSHHVLERRIAEVESQEQNQPSAPSSESLDEVKTSIQDIHPTELLVIPSAPASDHFEASTPASNFGGHLLLPLDPDDHPIRPIINQLQATSPLQTSALVGTPSSDSSIFVTFSIPSSPISLDLAFEQMSVQSFTNPLFHFPQADTPPAQLAKPQRSVILQTLRVLSSTLYKAQIQFRTLLKLHALLLSVPKKSTPQNDLGRSVVSLHSSTMDESTLFRELSLIFPDSPSFGQGEASPEKQHGSTQSLQLTTERTPQRTHMSTRQPIKPEDPSLPFSDPFVRDMNETFEFQIFVPFSSPFSPSYLKATAAILPIVSSPLTTSVESSSLSSSSSSLSDEPDTDAMTSERSNFPFSQESFPSSLILHFSPFFSSQRPVSTFFESTGFFLLLSTIEAAFSSFLASIPTLLVLIKTQPIFPHLPPQSTSDASQPTTQLPTNVSSISKDLPTPISPSSRHLQRTTRQSLPSLHLTVPFTSTRRQSSILLRPPPPKSPSVSVVLGPLALAPPRKSIPRTADRLPKPADLLLFSESPFTSQSPPSPLDLACFLRLRMNVSSSIITRTIRSFIHRKQLVEQDLICSFSEKAEEYVHSQIRQSIQQQISRRPSTSAHSASSTAGETMNENDMAALNMITPVVPTFVLERIVGRRLLAPSQFVATIIIAQSCVRGWLARKRYSLVRHAGEIIVNSVYIAVARRQLKARREQRILQNVQRHRYLSRTRLKISQQARTISESSTKDRMALARLLLLVHQSQNLISEGLLQTPQLHTNPSTAHPHLFPRPDSIVAASFPTLPPHQPNLQLPSSSFSTLPPPSRLATNPLPSVSPPPTSSFVESTSDPLHFRLGTVLSLFESTLANATRKRGEERSSRLLHSIISCQIESWQNQRKQISEETDWPDRHAEMEMPMFSSNTDFRAFLFDNEPQHGQPESLFHDSFAAFGNRRQRKGEREEAQRKAVWGKWMALHKVGETKHPERTHVKPLKEDHSVLFRLFEWPSVPVELLEGALKVNDGTSDSTQNNRSHPKEEDQSRRNSQFGWNVFLEPEGLGTNKLGGTQETFCDGNWEEDKDAQFLRASWDARHKKEKETHHRTHSKPSSLNRA